MAYSNTYTPNTGHNYESLRLLISTARDHKSKPVQNNTRAEYRGDNIAIKLHGTDVVTVSPENIYTLNSGGWLTVTTKDRINGYSPAGISQKAGIWYMSDGTRYFDGVQVDITGRVLNPANDTADYEKKLKDIKKQARAYAKGFVEALQAGTVDYPSGGDCWACCMRGPEGQESFKGSGHIQDHMTEKYYVPSLLVNAGRAAGYRNEQIGMMGIGGRRLFIDPENNIYKYIVKQLQKEL